MNPHVEAWRAKQDQLKGQTEGQIAGSTLVMMNSVCSQLKDEVLDIKRTADGINNTFVSVEDRLKSATDVIQQGAQKVAKNAQQMIQEVGNEVKISITDACKNLKDKYDDKVKEYNKLSAFIYWLYNGDTEAYKAKYREFEAATKPK